ncbi:MAG: bifunctional adenosylcobinamide kinase/adenosylcobinamide-phosphate guanylyltransferase [Desulfobulbus sp.]|nr:bifunctional adenosylcobinamide kinase/adenosylcobinamide-phosphate guanylyltransferase [Desulfobulbus sp.]
MGRLILVTGGARSGKSSFAEQLVAELGQEIAYIATARPFDAEMEDRIAKHRLQRPSSWQTFETPTEPSQVVTAQGNRVEALLLDCMTVLITNRILTHSVDWDQPNISQLNEIEADILGEINALLSAAADCQADLVAVTNEVGYGIVPVSPLSRFFRDCAGRVNQRMAAAADEVYLVVSGIPVQIKGAARCNR